MTYFEMYYKYWFAKNGTCALFSVKLCLNLLQVEMVEG